MSKTSFSIKRIYEGFVFEYLLDFDLEIGY